MPEQENDNLYGFAKDSLTTAHIEQSLEKSLTTAHIEKLVVTPAPSQSQENTGNNSSTGGTNGSNASSGK